MKDERIYYKPEECQATVLLFWDEGSRKPIREEERLGLHGADSSAEEYLQQLPPFRQL